MRALPDINVADFDTPIGNLTLRDGRKVPIVRADLGAAQLAQRLTSDPGNIDLQIECLSRMMPDASEADLLTLNEVVIAAVVARARIGIAEAEGLLGESSGAGVTSTNDSAPESPTPSSAHESAATTG